jgi:hypothetical protein
VRAYIDHLNGWIAQLNDLIGKLHVVLVEKVTDVVDDDGRPQVVLKYWMAQHIRDGVIVDTFTGEVGDLSSSTRLRVERQARDSRNSGVAEDRENLGVLNMEGVAESWEQSIGVDLRLNLVRQVLNRPARAIDFSPNGLMVDGRVIPADLDLRTTLIELLTSQEFRRRIKTIWQGFIDRDRDELVQFAVRRLFGRDPEVDENEALRQLARRYGFGAFVAALLYSDEYEQRFGAGLPGAETRDEDRPITAELELQR